MQKNAIVWVIVALVVFALGYVGFGLYHAQRQQQAQSVPSPSLPSF